MAAAIEQQGEQDVQQQRSAVRGSNGTLLNFLYPAGTWNFLRQCSGYGGGRFARNGLEKLGYRQYTSYAPQDTVSNTAVDAPGAAAEIDNTVAESQRMALLQEKLRLSTSFDYEEAWRRYTLLEDRDQQSVLRVPLMQYLSTSERFSDAERTTELFEALEQEQMTPVTLRFAIRAYLEMRNLADAMTLYTTALETFKYPAGAEELLVYLIKNSSWSRAFSIWKDYEEFRAQSTESKGPSILQNLGRDPAIGTQAIELAGYVNRRLENTSPDALSDESADLVEFASRFVRKALLNEQAFDSTRFFSLLSILQNWKLLTPNLFGVVTDMLIRLNETKLAIKCYRRARWSKEVLFSRRTLHTLLKICCDHHSVLGMQQILDDFFRIYSKPTRLAYRMCMSEFANLGDAQTVHALFDQLVARDSTGGHSSLQNPGEIAPVLHVHAKRGELQEVVSYFDQIQDVYNLEPDLRCWNILINAYGKIGDVDRAYDCFEQLLDNEQLRPDDYTMGTLMGICTARGDVDRVIGLYKFAEEQQISTSAAMVDCLVLTHVQADDLMKAETICEDALKMVLKGTRTRMWNYLIVGHAMNRDLLNVNRLLTRMSEAGIHHDKYTYAALMQSLVMVKQPDRAFAIMTDVMRPSGIQVTSFHYAILMGGYIVTNQFHKVFQLQRRMEKRNQRPTASTKLLALEATVAQDSRLLEDGTSQEILNRALQIFQETISSMDAQDISDPARKGVGQVPLDIAYSTMIYRFMISVLGNYAEFSSVDDLFQAYTKTLPASPRDKPPLDMLFTIMSAKFAERDHETIQKCWEASVMQAKELGQAIVADVGNFPEDHLVQREWQGIMPARQLELSRHLGVYMKSLHVQRKTNEMIATVDGLISDGFALDNHNWNAYITFLAIRHKYELGFRLCEAYLMDQWNGWARIRWTLPERNRLSVDLRAKRQKPTFFRPKYLTILHLARGYLELQSMAAESPNSEVLLDDLERDCPRVVRAIVTMQRVDDHLERTILRGY
ncbi:related to coxI translation protein CYA5 [Rhynchosporium agropyri]|uniref:Related to coxI translation protein CYA5 n=1 Tax=Rhynchosporium agropyri TaxID=914238 RepID=A0A1E1K6H7_9HELO|nr:related to coxI translation protein CYA5 [Rhynchosporium agropyri]